VFEGRAAVLSDGSSNSVSNSGSAAASGCGVWSEVMLSAFAGHRSLTHIMRIHTQECFPYVDRSRNYLAGASGAAVWNLGAGWMYG